MRRAKSSRKQYVRETNAKSDVEVESKIIRKRLDKTEDKLKEYKKIVSSIIAERDQTLERYNLYP